MADAAAEAVTAALLEHRPRRTFERLLPESIPDRCTCGARDLVQGDRREAHLADVAVAALTAAGLLAAPYTVAPPGTVGHAAAHAWAAYTGDDLEEFPALHPTERAHWYDVARAILTPASAIVTRSDVTLEARWRAAALEIVTAWTVPGRMPQLHQLAREQLETHWPSLAGPIRRLVQAKAELLGERS